MYNKTYYATDPKSMTGTSNEDLQSRYLINDLFVGGDIRLNYLHYERFVIGGVAPLAHTFAPVVLMDEDLLAFARVWPAAGHPNTMFHIPPQQLAEITQARIAEIALI